MTKDSDTISTSHPPPRTALVVGAGILGASFAYQLSKAGLEVTILDAVAPHAGASGGSWAWINAAAADRPDYRALRNASIDAYHDLDQALGGALPIDWTGSLLWDPFLTAALTPNMPGYTKLSGTEIKARFPQIKTPPPEAWVSERDGLLDGTGAVQALLNASNALLQTGRPATGLLQEEGRVLGVQTAYGPATADITVLAAGTGTSALIGDIAPLPTKHRTGLLAITTPLADRLPMALWSETVHVKQMRDGRLMIGEASHEDGALDHSTALAAKLLEEAEALLDVGPLTLDRVTIATRPIPGDGLPVIGAPNGTEGLYIAMMHSGMTLAAISGRLGTREILTGATEPLLEPFRLERFAGQV